MFTTDCEVPPDSEECPREGSRAQGVSYGGVSHGGVSRQGVRYAGAQDRESPTRSSHPQPHLSLQFDVLDTDVSIRKALNGLGWGYVSNPRGLGSGYASYPNPAQS